MGRKDQYLATVHIKPFRFPNFLMIDCRIPDAKISVGEISEADAAALWDGMKEHWLAHCAEKRKNWRR